MTTVVGLARDGGVWMAADTRTNVYERPVHDVRKIARLVTETGESLLLAVAGDGAIAHAARYDLSVAAPDQDDLNVFAYRLAEAVTRLAVDRGVLSEGRMDSNLLLGFRGRLWTLVHHQAIAHPDGLAALGSGEGPAMGALWALERNVHLDGATAVERACEAGILFDRYSGGAIQVESLEAPR